MTKKKEVLRACHLCHVSQTLPAQGSLLGRDDVIEGMLLDAVPDGLQPEVTILGGAGTHSKQKGCQHLVYNLASKCIGSSILWEVPNPGVDYCGCSTRVDSSLARR